MTSAANAGSFKAAIEKIRPSIIARQWLGNAAALLLAFAWLRVPDSHAWQFLLSVILGLAIVATFLWLHATTFRLLRTLKLPVPTPVQLLILVCFIFFWMFLLQPISATRSFEPLLAGYVNSKFSPQMRSFFTFARLVQWQEYLLDLLEWLIAGLLLPAAMAAVATGKNARTFRGLSFVYQRWQYWASGVSLRICRDTPDDCAGVMDSRQRARWRNDQRGNTARDRVHGGHSALVFCSCAYGGIPRPRCNYGTTTRRPLTACANLNGKLRRSTRFRWARHCEAIRVLWLIRSAVRSHLPYLPRRHALFAKRFCRSDEKGWRPAS